MQCKDKQEIEQGSATSLVSIVRRIAAVLRRKHAGVVATDQSTESSAHASPDSTERMRNKHCLRDGQYKDQPLGLVPYRDLRNALFRIDCVNDAELYAAVRAEIELRDRFLSYNVHVSYIDENGERGSRWMRVE